VNTGTENADTVYTVSNDAACDIGTDDLTLTKVSAAADITAGQGMVRNTNSFDVVH